MGTKPVEMTLSERAAILLRHSILAGELLPGTKLRIQNLAETYEIGTTPLREALSRLVTAGLVDAVGHRGFRVAETSRGDLEDIILARTLVETEALRLSLERGDDIWEANLVGALHRLYKFTRDTDSNFREGMAQFDTVHKAFHTALLAACGSPRLLELHSNLYDQTYRYRRVVLRGVDRPNEVDEEHEELLDLALARNSSVACEKLRGHLSITLSRAYPPEDAAQGAANSGIRRNSPAAPAGTR